MDGVAVEDLFSTFVVGIKKKVHFYIIDATKCYQKSVQPIYSKTVKKLKRIHSTPAVN